MSPNSRPRRQRKKPGAVPVKSDAEAFREAEEAVIAAAMAADPRIPPKKRSYRPRASVAKKEAKPKQPRPKRPPKSPKPPKVKKATPKRRPTQNSNKKRIEEARGARYRAQVAAARSAANQDKDISPECTCGMLHPAPQSVEEVGAAYERHLFNIFKDYTTEELDSIIAEIEGHNHDIHIPKPIICSVSGPVVPFSFDAVPAVPVVPLIGIKTEDIGTVDLNSVIFSGHAKVKVEEEVLAELLDVDPLAHLNVDPEYLLNLDNFLMGLVPEESWELDPRLVLREHDYARPGPPPSTLQSSRTTKKGQRQRFKNQTVQK